MIFITEGFKQNFLDVLLGSLLDKICAEWKINGSGSQNGMGQLKGDVRFVDADIHNFNIQFFILEKYFADGFFIVIFNAAVSSKSEI